MSNSSDLEMLMPEISAISKEETKKPSMPAGIFQQEAEDLHFVAYKDQEKLVARGLDSELIPSLLLRAGALRQAQSLWAEKQNKQTDAVKHWKLWAPEAAEFRDDMIDELDYAFRNNEGLQKAIGIIRDGESNADLVQDLNDLSVLGNANKKLLEQIKFDICNLEKLAELSDVGAGILAISNGNRFNENEERILRDKAYTYLKMAVDEVRDCGKFVFRKDANKLKDYRSKYLRTKNRKRVNINNESIA